MRAGSSKLPSVSFYTIADSRYFPGVAAMVSSLRMQGHNEVVYVLDCGLEADQRAALATETTIVPAENGCVPQIQKFVLPLERPSDVMVLVDADIIFTRPLGELLAPAAEGRVVAFSDNSSCRHFVEWAELLGLSGVAPRTYLNAGLLVLPREPGVRILRRAQAGLACVDLERSVLGSGSDSYPFYYLDQDVFNAVLSALTESSQVLPLQLRLAPAPPFRGVRVVDEPRPRCRYVDGVEPYALHCWGLKPWLTPTRANAYSRLLTRVLLDPSAAVSIRSDCLPLRLRDGALAASARRGRDIRAAVRSAPRRACLAADMVRSRTRWRRSRRNRDENRMSARVSDRV